MRAHRKDGVERAATATVIGVYVVACLEVAVMSTPFAAYFYGVYSPVLTLFEASPNLRWLDAFFMSHISHPDSVLLTVLKKSGIVLAAVGLLSFLTHALYLYWVRFRHRRVATRLLYAWVRHPQYVALMVAGAGLAIIWPRFLSVVLLLVMCVTYDALARLEERRMVERHGDDYSGYAAHKGRFLPGGPGERLSRILLGWLPGKQWRVAFSWAGVWAISLSAAFLLRGHSVGQLTTFVLSASPDTLYLAFDAPDAAVARGAAEDVSIATREVAPCSSRTLVYLIWEKKRLRHFLIDGGVAQDCVRLDAIPDADHYVVLSDVEAPGHPGTRAALRLSAVRTLRRVICVSANPDGGSTWRFFAESLVTLPHASLPVL